MKKRLIQSVERAISILTLVRHSAEPLTIADLSDVLGIPRTTLYPIVKTLEEYDLIFREERSRRINLGWKLYDLGLGYVEQNADLATREEARRLRTKWQQTMYSGTYVGSNRVVFTIVEVPDSPFYASPQLGFFANAHATSSGKMLLAHMDCDDLTWIREPDMLPQRGPRTIVDPEKLLGELENVKAAGYAIDDEESLEGLMCIAVPIFDFLGKCTRTLSISGPKSEISKNFEAMKADLLLSAKRLSQASSPWRGK